MFIYNVFSSPKHRGRMNQATWKKYEAEAKYTYGKAILSKVFKDLLASGAIKKIGDEYWWPDVQKRQYKRAKADVTPVRQRSQYTCMATSMMMCLRANGVACTEDEVNEVMGARPMRGASWENALACAQHYGMRATLTTPSTVQQLKDWTDRGIPVMIAWNPEGREWSHASVVFDVDEELNVYVADSNIPDPDETVRVVSKKDFYAKWFEKWPNYLVRRPACAIEREITPDGRQVMASDLRSAKEDYLQAVTNLESSMDLVATATNHLRALGSEPQDENYPFGDDIEVVASDIFRWRDELDRKFAKVASRVARAYLNKK